MLIPDLTQNQATTGSREIAPEGVHVMRIVSVEDRVNEKGNTTVFLILENEKSQIARDNFTIMSTSGANVEIGRNRLKGLLACLGLPFVGTDTALLIGLFVRAHVKHEEFTGRDGKTIQTAKVAAYEKLTQSATPQPQASVPQTVQKMDDSQCPF